MNRRGLLRSLSLLPIGAVAASLGIEARQAAPTTGVLRLPNADFITYRNAASAGIISRETALKHFGITDLEFLP